MAVPVPFHNAAGVLIPPHVLAMFAGPAQVRATLADYAAQEPSVIDEAVPGDNRVSRRSSDRSRRSSAGLLFWGSQLHDSNFCLHGGDGAAFPEEAFAVDLTGSVKGSWMMVHWLRPLNEFNQGWRSVDMHNFAGFLRHQIYRVNELGGGDLPQVVLTLLDDLEAFTPDQYLLIKTHPALEDCVGESEVFIQLNASLQGLKETDRQQYDNIIAYIENDINSFVWVFDGIQNTIIHELLGYNSNAKSRKAALASFLGKNLQCGSGTAEDLLTVRRNGHSHLCKDYRVVPAGHHEAFQAALTAVLIKKPQLRGAYPGFLVASTAPFSNREAILIAEAIDEQLDLHKDWAPVAVAAATAIATYYGNLQPIRVDPAFYKSQVSTVQYQIDEAAFNLQQIAAKAAATNEAALVKAQLRLYPSTA